MITWYLWIFMWFSMGWPVFMKLGPLKCLHINIHLPQILKLATSSQRWNQSGVMSKMWKASIRTHCSILQSDSVNTPLLSMTFSRGLVIFLTASLFIRYLCLFVTARVFVYDSVCLCMCASMCVFRRTVQRQSVSSLSQRWSWLSRSLCWITSSSGAFLMSQSSYSTVIRPNNHITFMDTAYYETS